MLIPITTKQFEKDVKKAKKQGKEIRKLKQVMKYLIYKATKIEIIF